MILFLNVLITDDYITLYNRGRLGRSSDRLDIFKYCLASLAPLSWSRVIIYCELHEPYRSRLEELERYIFELFPHAEFQPRRNCYQKEWRPVIENILASSNKEFIWFSCNDDHIFIDYELELFNRINKRLALLNSEHEFVSSFLSHWPENMAFLREGHRTGYLPNGQELKRDPIAEYEDGFVNRWCCLDSIQIVNSNLLKYWWLDHDYGETFLPRSDSPNQKHVTTPNNIACFIPYRETVRHFDGYSQGGVHINVCPPLTIPPGFFEGDLKIQLGGERRLPGYVYINPRKTTYSCVDHAGADLRCLQEDLPYFWKNRIVEVNVQEDLNHKEWVGRRNDAVLKLGERGIGSRPLQEFASRIRIALRTYQGETPYSQNPFEHTFHFYRSLYGLPRSKPVPLLSIIIVDSGLPLEKGQDSAPFQKLVLESLLNQTASRDAYELIWVSVKGNTQSREFRNAFDQFVISNQEFYWKLGTYHIHRGFNDGLLEAKGSVVSFCNSAALFDKEFVQVVSSFFATQADGPARRVALHRQGLLISTEPCHLRPSFSMLRKSLIELGGFDVSDMCLGKAGDGQELLNRLKQRDYEFIPTEFPVVISLADNLYHSGIDLQAQILEQSLQRYDVPTGNSDPVVELERRMYKEWRASVSTPLDEVNGQLLSGDFEGGFRSLHSAVNSRAEPLLKDALQLLESFIEKRYEQLPEALDSLLVRYPDSLTVRNFAAFVFVLLAQTQRAKDLVLGTLRKDPGNWNGFTLLSFLLTQGSEASDVLHLQRKLSFLYPSRLD